MAFEIQTTMDKRLVYSNFFGIVTADDVRDEITETQAFAGESELPLRLIVNFSDVEKIMMSLWDVRQITAGTTDHYELTLIVANNPVIRFLSSVASQIMGSEFRFFSTLDEATNFLEVMDENINSMAMS